MNILKLLSTPVVFSPNDLHLYRKAQLLNFLLLFSLLTLSLSTQRNYSYYLLNGASLREYIPVYIKMAWCVILLMSYYLFKVKHYITMPAWVSSLCVIWVVGELVNHNPTLAAPLILLVPIMVFSLIGILWGGLVYLAFACYTLFLVAYDGHVVGALNPNALFYNYFYALLLGGGAACFLEVGKLEVIDKLHNFATRDALTQCWNRNIFLQSLDSEILKARRLQKNFSLVMFDIDYFKRVNDTYGHQTGDIVLKEFVNIINHNIRDTDIFARWGGEEFTLLLPGADIASAVKKVESILMKLRKHQFVDIGNVTCSAGLTGYTEKMPAKDLLHNADIALYKAKKLGRDQVVVG